MRTLTAVALLTLAGTAEAQTLRIGSEKAKFDALPEALPDMARAALSAWKDFAQSHEYEMRLDGGGRFLLLSPEGDKQTGRRAKLVEQTADRFDRLLPVGAADTAPVVVPGELEAEDEQVIPEDPEGEWEDPFAEDEPEPEPEPEPEQAGPVAWGAGGQHVPDGETAVLIALRHRDDLGKLLRELVGRFPYLTDWAPQASGQAGFVLQLPLLGAALVEAPEQEEWNPHNELVNRAMQLFVLRRFGPQPHWIVQGLAWDAELDLLDGVYCFPYRTGFVGVGEHTGWKLDLKHRIGRLERDLAGSDFMHWGRGSYVDRYARYAWGLMHYLAHERPGDLARYLDALRGYAHEHDRRDVGDGKWERDPNFEIPLSVQEELLLEHLGTGVWGAVTRYFTG